MDNWQADSAKQEEEKQAEISLTELKRTQRYFWSIKFPVKFTISKIMIKRNKLSVSSVRSVRNFFFPFRLHEIRRKP